MLFEEELDFGSGLVIGEESDHATTFCGISNLFGVVIIDAQVHRVSADLRVVSSNGAYAIECGSD